MHHCNHKAIGAAVACRKRHRSRSSRRGLCAQFTDADRKCTTKRANSDFELAHAVTEVNPTEEVAGLPAIQTRINFGAGTHRSKAMQDNTATNVTIFDRRADTARFHLEQHGFQLLPSPCANTEALDMFDADIVYRSFYPYIEQLVLRYCAGATRAIIFDHNVRDPQRLATELARAASRPDDNSQAPQTPFLQGVLASAHGDYTARSGPSRTKQLLAPYVESSELEAALASRFAIVNVWCPLDTVKSDPLALCTWHSISPQDVLTNRLHFKHRTGETYKVRFSPHQKWTYFSDMTKQEALMFKTFDSSTEASRFCMHSAFQLPEQEERNLPARKSIELRVMVFWGQGLETLASDFVPPHMMPANPAADELSKEVPRAETVEMGDEW